MKTDYSKSESIRQYRLAILVCSILVLIGIFGGLTGAYLHMGSLELAMDALAPGSFLALIYSLIRWDDIRKKCKK